MRAWCPGGSQRAPISWLASAKEEHPHQLDAGIVGAHPRGFARTLERCPQFAVLRTFKIVEHVVMISKLEQRSSAESRQVWIFPAIRSRYFPAFAINRHPDGQRQCVAKAQDALAGKPRSGVQDGIRVGGRRRKPHPAEEHQGDEQAADLIVSHRDLRTGLPALAGSGMRSLLTC
jgi:hypothetical protein